MRLLLHANFGDGGWDALAAGAKAAGHRVIWQAPGVWNPSCLDRRAEVVVVHGLSGNASRIRDAYRGLGCPVWIVDLPRLREELDAIGLYLNDLQWTPPTAHGRKAVVQPALQGRTKTHALVCGQKPGDFAHGMDLGQVEAWTRETIARTRAETGLPVLYRPHPKHKAALPPDGFGADEVVLPDHPLRVDLARTAVLVTCNSTAGWEAIAAGVPVHATDRGASYAPYTTPLNDPRPLAAARRIAALGRTASTQWTMDELRDPDTIRWLFAHHAAPVEAAA